MLLSILALLFVATAAVAAGDVVSYSYPAFDATTTRDDSLVAATNSSVLTTARLLFEPEFPSDFNVSEGFLLLSDEVDVWRAGVGSAGAPAREASFNTSFTVGGGGGGASPPVSVAFVVLLDRYPTLNDPAGLRGKNVSADDGDDGNATSSLVAVQVGTVKSYGRESPNVGLNVTVRPNRTAAGSGGTTVWVQYNAVEHRISVYAAAAGEPRPAKALLDVPLYLAGIRTTKTALVGFFASAIRDIIVGVRDWELTVDRLRDDGHGGGKKSTSWLVILLVVLGSVAAAAAMVSVVVCCFVLKRRRREVEPKQ